MAKPKPSKYKKRQYYQYTKDGRFLKQWDGSKAIIENFEGVTVYKLAQACRGQRKTLAGYSWKYEKTE